MDKIINGTYTTTNNNNIYVPYNSIIDTCYEELHMDTFQGKKKEKEGLSIFFVI